MPVVLFSTNDEEKDVKVVYSVFSKTPKTVFRELLPKGSPSRLDLETILGTWAELTEMVDDGDVSVQELQGLYATANKGDGLDQSAFEQFYRSIDDLFDDDCNDEEEEDDDASPEDSSDENEVGATTTSDPKTDLLGYLEEIQSLECETINGEVNVGKRRPWGLDSSDGERAMIFEKIEALCDRTNDNNILSVGRSDKELTNYFLGTWDLKYTSSRTMLINKSLSGLGRSTSDLVKNRGLQMSLRGTYYFGEAEFVETFSGEDQDENEDEPNEDESSDPDEDDPIRIEFKVNGEWMLETGTRTDPKTGRPSVSLRVEVETIAYGPNKSKADQWDSLSPIKLVDVLYLDKTLMVARGNFNLDALFVYERLR